MRLAAGLLLALAASAALNASFYIQHEAASGMPPLRFRRPIHSLRLLFTDLKWFLGWLGGWVGWGLYVLALRFAPLSLSQAVVAGGVGLIALLAWHRAKVVPSTYDKVGIRACLGGLALVAASLGARSASCRKRLAAGRHLGSCLRVGGWDGGRRPVEVLGERCGSRRLCRAPLRGRRHRDQGQCPRPDSPLSRCCSPATSPALSACSWPFSVGTHFRPPGCRACSTTLLRSRPALLSSTRGPGGPLRYPQDRRLRSRRARSISHRAKASPARRGRNVPTDASRPCNRCPLGDGSCLSRRRRLSRCSRRSAAPRWRCAEQGPARELSSLSSRPQQPPGRPPL